MESITANELAGLGVGALLLAAALATPKVDAFIARAQRRYLLLLSSFLSFQLVVFSLASNHAALIPALEICRACYAAFHALITRNVIAGS